VHGADFSKSLSPPVPQSPNSLPTIPLTHSSYLRSDLATAIKYAPPPAQEFSMQEVLLHKNLVTRQTCANFHICHPPGVIVELPETGKNLGQAVAHVFAINSTEFSDPKLNIQYSLGDCKGGRREVKCYLLEDIDGKSPVPCRQYKISCMIFYLLYYFNFYFFFYLGCGMKHCTFNVTPSFPTPGIDLASPVSKEDFLKTFGLFCALQETGCSFSSKEEDYVTEENADTDACILYEVLRDVRSPRPNVHGKLCHGKLIF
jgi:hypothetical protein